MELNTFHSRVKTLRISKRNLLSNRRLYTQTWVANELGISRQTYIDLEAGNIEPRLSVIADLSSLLECDVAYLIHGDEKRNVEDLLLPDEVEFILNGQKYLARKFKN